MTTSTLLHRRVGAMPHRAARNRHPRNLHPLLLQFHQLLLPVEYQVFLNPPTPNIAAEACRRR